MNCYKIADISFLIDGLEAFPYSLERLSAYRIDMAENFSADVKMTVRDVDFIPVPDRKPEASGYTLRRYYRDCDSCDIYIVTNEGDGAWAHIHSNITWSDLTVETSSAHILGIDAQFFMFHHPLWDAVRNIIAQRGGLVLHSSAISYKKQGILFSANSGVGKSTHTKLWQKLYPNDVEIVNDDTPAIFFKNDRPYMYGLPWSGKGENRNIVVPLKAIVFLERSVENTISPSDIDSSVFCIMEQISKSVFVDTFDKILLNVDKLLRSVDYYRIGVNMTDYAARMVKNTVFGDK